MKSLFFGVIFLVGIVLTAKSQVVFDSTDVEILRQMYLQKNYGKALDVKQMKMFTRLNTAVNDKGNLPIVQLDDDIIESFLGRYFFDYQEYKRAETNALKFEKVIKYVAKNKPELFKKNKR